MEFEVRRPVQLVAFFVLSQLVQLFKRFAGFYRMCIFITKIHMRTNIVIDDDLMQEALKRSGLSTKRATVEYALELLIKLKRQESIKDYRGKLKWEGDLDQIRKD
jgi:Arc/MetJ family transcription regulator